MPAYDYRCERCGDFEVQRRMSDPPLDACPNCSGPVERVISRNVNFVFKGSGFYITDYRGDGYKKDAAADKDSPAKAADPAKASPTGSEAKPAAPAPPAASPSAESKPSSPASKPASGSSPA